MRFLKNTTARAVAALLLFSAVFGLVSCKAPVKRTTYALTLDFDGERTLTGKETVVYKNEQEEPTDKLLFNLPANAYRKGAAYSPVDGAYTYVAFPKGRTYGSLTVSDVEVNGKAVKADVGGEDGTLLSVPLPALVFPNETATVTFSFTLTLATDAFVRTGANAVSVNLGNFYPVLCPRRSGETFSSPYYSLGDPFCSEVADYDVRLTLPADFAVAASGEMKSVADGEEKKTYVYRLERARDFAFVLSKNYESLVKTVGKTTVCYYYQSDKNPKKTLDTAGAALETFSALFGEYPYKTYTVAETGLFEGGMEYPCLSMVSSSLTETPEDLYEVVVHETAHQWWYGIVGNDETAHAFLDEGLTEYSTVLFYEKNPSYNRTRAELVDVLHKSYQNYCSVFDALRLKKDTTMTRPLSAFSSEYEYVSIAYVKGALLFEYLRSTVGDDAFYKGLNAYREAYAYKIATPDDLVGTFERLGCNTNGFFESWFTGKVVL